MDLQKVLCISWKKKIGEYKRNDGALQKNVNIGKAPERLRAENFLNAHHSFFMSRNLEKSIYVNINLLWIFWYSACEKSMNSGPHCWSRWIFQGHLHQQGLILFGRKEWRKRTMRQKPTRLLWRSNCETWCQNSIGKWSTMENVSFYKSYALFVLKDMTVLITIYVFLAQ